MLRSAAVLPLLLCIACGGASERAGRTEVMDSAGIQLVRNGGQVDTVTLQPDLTIGTVDGPDELQFFRVSALAVTPAGRVLVGDGSGTIREFDSAGAFLRRFGRRGAGPGEFQRPSAIHVYGDTTAVVDAGLFRITEFDAGGAVLGTIPLRQDRTIVFPTARANGGWLAERGRADLPVNETLPALGRLIVSDEGVLWAKRPDLAADPVLLEWTREGTRQDTFWDVFDHEGRFIVTARLPAAFRPMSAGQRSMYGVLRDDLDVEHIARLTLPVRD